MLSQGDLLREYEIQSVIGRGGFGVVYRGKHQELGIDVAVKEYFPPELSVRKNQTIRPSNPELQESFEDGMNRFLKEAKQLEKFRDCPNIVTCRDLFRANGTAYMVMDYISGLPLSVLLEKREANDIPFEENDLIDLILPLLIGLQEVHDSGVCHRDIKPSNILIRRSDGSPILIDFGAAKHGLNKHTKSFAPYTDGYAAMEQVGEGKIGPWTDMYGLGAVMWRVVAGGNPPFYPINPPQIQKRAFAQIQSQPDPMPSALETGKGRFSDKILQAIDGCLIVNVDDRIQNCNELIRKLDDCGIILGQTKIIELAEQRQRMERSGQFKSDATQSPVNQKQRHPQATKFLFFSLLGILVILSGIAVTRFSSNSNWQQSVEQYSNDSTTSDNGLDSIVQNTSSLGLGGETGSNVKSKDRSLAKSSSVRQISTVLKTTDDESPLIPDDELGYDMKNQDPHDQKSSSTKSASSASRPPSLTQESKSEIISRRDTLRGITNKYQTTVDTTQFGVPYISVSANSPSQVGNHPDSSEDTTSQQNEIYIVRNGDTLLELAAKYGTSALAIYQANGLRNTQLKSGQRLLIPREIVIDSVQQEQRPYTSYSISTADQSIRRSNSSEVSGSNRVHMVRRGDTLSKIATKYGTTVRAIQRENGLRNTRIKRGQRLQIPQGGRTIHIVRRGENLTKIANRYGTSVRSIKASNNLRSSTVYPGQKLQIHH